MTELAAEVEAARATLDGFMVAFNAEDDEAIRRNWFHFPHVRLHSGGVSLIPTPEEYRNLVALRQGQSRDWARSEWDYVECVDAGAEKVHFRVQFSRYRADGSLIGRYRSLWVVVLKDGRWGVQARSSWAE